MFHLAPPVNIQNEKATCLLTSIRVSGPSDTRSLSYGCPWHGSGCPLPRFGRRWKTVTQRRSSSAPIALGGKSAEKHIRSAGAAGLRLLFDSSNGGWTWAVFLPTGSILQSCKEHLCTPTCQQRERASRSNFQVRKFDFDGTEGSEFLLFLDSDRTISRVSRVSVEGFLKECVRSGQQGGEDCSVWRHLHVILMSLSSSVRECIRSSFQTRVLRHVNTLRRHLLPPQGK